MIGRYDLTDEHFALIEAELPTNDGKTGHPWNPHRPIINGIFAHRAAADTPTQASDGLDEPPDHALGRFVGGFSTKIQY